MPPAGWKGQYAKRKDGAKPTADSPGSSGLGGSNPKPVSGNPSGDTATWVDTSSGSGNSAANPSSAKPRTGNNLEKDKPAPKSVKVEFDVEKLKAAFPKFMRLAFKAANNVFKLLSFLPFVPVIITFEDLSPEEEEIFKEAAWPGFEAALPAAAKKHPIAFLMSAVSLLTLGKISFKPKPPKPPKTEKAKDGATPQEGKGQ